MHKKILLLVCLLCALQLSLADARAMDFIVLGDSRPGTANKNFEVAESVIADALVYVQGDADFPHTPSGIILTGDYVLSGNDTRQWEKFRNAYEPAFNYPLFPCLGNHDIEGNNLAYFQWNYFKTFHVFRWYSVNIGDLHLVILDSDLANFSLLFPEVFLLELLQYGWFKKDLSNNSQKYTIVAWHEPAYTSHPGDNKGHGSNLFMRARYVPVCETFNVDLVLCGHNHWYERTVPIRNGVGDWEGVTYLTTGGGGADLYPVSAKWSDTLRDAQGNSLSEVNVSEYHFCILHIDDDGITVEAIQHGSHKIIDSFEIKK